jgi:preprotein translocase subunit SecG
MEIFLLAIHVIAAVAILVLVLLQQGKGADMGASFGSGSAGSVFGAAGSANFLSRSTAVAAVVFFSTSVFLTYLGAHRPTGGGGVMQGVTATEPAKVDAAKSDVPKTEAPKTDAGKSDAAKTDAVKVDAAKSDTKATEPQKTDVPK